MRCARASLACFAVVLKGCAVSVALEVRSSPVLSKLQLRRSAARCLAGASLALGALPCLAAPAATAMRFQGSYADQLHPLCERKIEVEQLDTKPRRYVAHFSGNDVGPKGIGPLVAIACDQENIDKYKLRTWAFDAEINGDKISAGDGIHEGQWNINGKNAANPWTGIRWNDGNRWIRKDDDAPK